MLNSWPIIVVRAIACRPIASISGSLVISKRTILKPPRNCRFSNELRSINWNGFGMRSSAGYRNTQSPSAGNGSNRARFRIVTCASANHPLAQRPLVVLESHVKRDRNQVRVQLRRIVTDQRPLEHDGAVDVIPVRQLSVKLAWKWVRESVVHVQEPGRCDEISDPA